MSKSDTNLKAMVNLNDKPEEIIEKFKKAVTDSVSRQVTYDPKERPGVANLIDIHCSFSGKTPAEVCEDNENITVAQFKIVLGEMVVEELAPIQTKLTDLLSNKDYLHNTLQLGEDKARSIAEVNIAEIKRVTGLI